MAAIPKLLPQFTPMDSKPVASAAPTQDNMLQQILAGQRQGGGFGLTPEILAKLMEPQNVDVVGQHNARSNLPSYSPHSTGPFKAGTGGFKPMEEAFPELAPQPGMAEPAPAPVGQGPFGSAMLPPAGSPSFVGPTMPNPAMANPNDANAIQARLNAMRKQQPGGFAFGAGSMPRF